MTDYYKLTHSLSTTNHKWQKTNQFIFLRWKRIVIIKKKDDISAFIKNNCELG